MAVLAPLAAFAMLLGLTVVATSALVAHQVPRLDAGLDELPPLEQAAARPVASPTTVLAADGSVLAQLVPKERFSPVTADAIPPLVANVVTASEDPGFFEHHGFDPASLARAGLTDVLAGRTVEGGSTITQQLAKNLYTDGSRTLGRKVRELAIAMRLEDRYSKLQLLAAYLSSTYFGEGAVGIRAAAAAYFSKPLEELDLAQLALLTAVIPAPSDRDPRTHPQVAEAARQAVLDRMAANHRAEQSAIDAARTEVPALAAPPTTTATEPWFVDYVRRWLVDVGHLSPDQVASGGLRVETTLDPLVQKDTEDAVAAHLADPQGPTAAAVVLDHRNGHVLALVGGRDWSSSQVDLARGADGGGTGRQAGSAFKPFVLATALAAGVSPNEQLPAPASMALDGADHPVENYSGEGYGSLSLVEATVHSVNTAYEWLTSKVGPQPVRELATSLGIGHLPTSVGPSIGLGAYETSPLDMATAYSAFAEDGRRVTPTPVARVVAPDGTVLIDRTAPAPGAQVLDPAVSRTVTSILEQVVQRGTGTAAQIDRPVAGKTGTTDEYANAWFVGYSAHLTTAVWVGYASANTPMHGIDGVPDVTGGTIPAAIWHDVMAAAEAGMPADPFPEALPLPSSAVPDAAVGSAPAPAPAPGPAPNPNPPPTKKKGH